MNSGYRGTTVFLTTKHAKAESIAPAFDRILGVRVVEVSVDTDRLGTFTGEIERTGSALDCVKAKCEWGLERAGASAEFGLASEGSFGPHPFIPFLPSDQEILYFIDRRRHFHLHMVQLSEKTNYSMEAVDSLDALRDFAHKALFPSHALIVRPNQWDDRSVIFKGITAVDVLEEAFRSSARHSADGMAWVETDMRAQFNPSRMAVIGELAMRMADRLHTLCPECRTPGWGKIRVETGLPCRWCGSPTGMTRAEIHGCTRCPHEETLARADGLSEADPAHCPDCNP